MVSILRTLQAEWNDLVPLAQERGIPRVRRLNGTLEPIAYRRERLEWLRDQLGMGSTALSTPEQVNFALDAMTFGVELEFLMPYGVTREMVARKINAAGVPCVAEEYNHGTRTHWKTVSDMSVADTREEARRSGCEVVSPVLRGEEGLEQLRKVCDVLTEMRCAVNKKCGLHVHVGARGQGVDFFKNIAFLYASAEGSIDQFMSPSRRASENAFCQPMMITPRALQNATNVNEVMAACGHVNDVRHVRNGQRYRKLNLQSFWQHGTVEFRHHQGTDEAKKAVNWTKLCLRMALAARDGARNAPTLQALFELTRTPADEVEYFRSRIAHFAQAEGRALPSEEDMGGELERRLNQDMERALMGALGYAATPAPVEDRTRAQANAFIVTGEALREAAHTPAAPWRRTNR